MKVWYSPSLNEIGIGVFDTFVEMCPPEQMFDRYVVYGHDWICLGIL